jgi:hypothetical protein
MRIQQLPPDNVITFCIALSLLLLLQPLLLADSSDNKTVNLLRIIKTLM